MTEKFCRKWRLPRHFWVLLHAVKHDLGQTALLPLRRKACRGFFRPKNPTASAGFQPANLGTIGHLSTSRPPQPLIFSNYSTECFLIFCFMTVYSVFLCCFVYCFSFKAVTLLFLYKSSDRCHRVETHLQ
jgi:hypothetical protein